VRRVDKYRETGWPRREMGGYEGRRIAKKGDGWLLRETGWYTVKKGSRVSRLQPGCH
jgi:hypothetical protein